MFMLNSPNRRVSDLDWDSYETLQYAAPDEKSSWFHAGRIRLGCLISALCAISAIALLFLALLYPNTWFAIGVIGIPFFAFISLIAFCVALWSIG